MLERHTQTQFKVAAFQHKCYYFWHHIFEAERHL